MVNFSNFFRAVFFSTAFLATVGSFSTGVAFAESGSDDSHRAKAELEELLKPLEPLLREDAPRAVAEPEAKPIGQTARGKCAAVHVAASEYEGRTRLYADVPVSEANPSEKGELFFCGGTVAQCSTSQPGFDWIKPAQTEEGRLALSTFIPAPNEHVTVLRIPPASAGGAKAACMEEVGIGAYDGEKGNFTLASSNVGSVAEKQGSSADAIIQRLKEKAMYAAQAAHIAAQRAIRAVTPQPIARPLPLQNIPPQYPVASSDQAIAQARANALASQGVLSHAVGNAPGIPYGVFEGIGYGVWPNVDTCHGPGPVVADAVATSANGLTYRVRFYQYSWRPGGATSMAMAH